MELDANPCINLVIKAQIRNPEFVLAFEANAKPNMAMLMENKPN